MPTVEQMIDSLVVDCNDSVKQIVGGNYIAWCKTMAQMVQKLALLKQNVKTKTAEELTKKDCENDGEE